MFLAPEFLSLKGLRFVFIRQTVVVTDVIGTINIIIISFANLFGSVAARRHVTSDHLRTASAHT